MNNKENVPKSPNVPKDLFLNFEPNASQLSSIRYMFFFLTNFFSDNISDCFLICL